MIRWDFPEPTTESWKKWRAKADAAADHLVSLSEGGAAVTADNIKSDLYKGGRDELWDAFHGKCAYCEAKFILDQSGDVEHYRPKLGVTDENDVPVVHPGYFWLAYDWRNLLPSCGKCNRLTKTPAGKLIGKGERFPVSGPRATKRGGEVKEVALFLHPVFDEPADHLTLDAKTGLLAGKTDRGKVTVELLGLNREGLPEERKKVYTSVRGIISDSFGALKHGEFQEAADKLDLLQQYKDGIEAYSWAGRMALAEDKKRLEPLIKFFQKF